MCVYFDTSWFDAFILKTKFFVQACAMSCDIRSRPDIVPISDQSVRLNTTVIQKLNKLERSEESQVRFSSLSSNKNRWNKRLADHEIRRALVPINFDIWDSHTLISSFLANKT